MWVIQHADLASEDFDMVLSAGDIDEGRWSSRHQAEIYMAWLEKFWTRRVFKLVRLSGPEKP